MIGFGCFLYCEFNDSVKEVCNAICTISKISF